MRFRKHSSELDVNVVRNISLKSIHEVIELLNGGNHRDEKISSSIMATLSFIKRCCLISSNYAAMFVDSNVVETCMKIIGKESVHFF